jgi:hypothetical protein
MQIDLLFLPLTPVETKHVSGPHLWTKSCGFVQRQILPHGDQFPLIFSGLAGTGMIHQD